MARRADRRAGRPAPTSTRSQPGRPSASGAPPGSTATPPGARHGSQARVHLRRSWRRSAPCRSARCGRRTCRSWTAKLNADGLADSYVHALHSPALADHGRRGARRAPGPQPVLAAHVTGAGRQRPYVATTEQVWALHDAMPEHLRPASCSARSSDCGSPRRAGCAWPTSTSCAASSRRRAVPGRAAQDRDVADADPDPAASWRSSSRRRTARGGGETLVTDGAGRPAAPWLIERAIRRRG